MCRASVAITGSSAPFFGSNYTNVNTLASGQTINPTITISGFNNKPIGTPFTGYVWLAYNGVSNSGQANLLAKVATIIVKASQSLIFLFYSILIFMILTVFRNFS